MAKRIQKTFRKNLALRIRPRNASSLSDLDLVRIGKYHDQKCAFTLCAGALQRVWRERSKELLKSYLFKRLTSIQFVSKVERMRLQLANVQRRSLNHVKRLKQKTMVVSHMWDYMLAQCKEQLKLNKLLFIKQFDGHKFHRIETFAKDRCIRELIRD